MRKIIVIQGKAKDNKTIPPVMGRIFLNSFNRVYNMDGIASGMFKKEEINSQWNELTMQKLKMNPFVEIYKASQMSDKIDDPVVGSGHTEEQMNLEEVKKSISILEGQKDPDTSKLEILRKLLVALQKQDKLVGIDRPYDEDTPTGALRRFRRKWNHLLEITEDTSKKDISFDEASSYMEDRRALLENSYGLDEDQLPPRIDIVANIIDRP